MTADPYNILQPMTAPENAQLIHGAIIILSFTDVDGDSAVSTVTLGNVPPTTQLGLLIFAQQAILERRHQ
jgi:hypothetical protein